MSQKGNMPPPCRVVPASLLARRGPRRAKKARRRPLPSPRRGYRALQSPRDSACPPLLDGVDFRGCLQRAWASPPILVNTDRASSENVAKSTSPRLSASASVMRASFGCIVSPPFEFVLIKKRVGREALLVCEVECRCYIGVAT